MSTRFGDEAREARDRIDLARVTTTSFAFLLTHFILNLLL